MKVKLSKDQGFKDKPHKAGDTVIVRKDVGERLIEQGLANRLIEKPENRIVAPPSNRGVQRFTGHKVFGRD